jgi:hypothetical protein
LEFRKTLLLTADLANTIIAFANDTGGKLYMGIFSRKLTEIKDE